MDFEEAQVRTGCPECGSANIRRSHRKGTIERFFSARMRRDPYRCDNCLARFFRYREGEPAERVYRAPSATPALAQKTASQGEALQKRRRMVFILFGSVSAVLATMFLIVFSTGGREPSPMLMRITRMFGKGGSAPAPVGKRRR